MVALSDRFEAWDVLAVGLKVLLLCSCRLLLGYPCLCQGGPVHLTCRKPENTPTHLKNNTHTKKVSQVWRNSNEQCCLSPYRCTFISSGKRTNAACASLTNLDLAGAGKTASTAAGSEATAARAVLPGPTSLSFWIHACKKKNNKKTPAPA